LTKATKLYVSESHSQSALLCYLYISNVRTWPAAGGK